MLNYFAIEMEKSLRNSVFPLLGFDDKDKVNIVGSSVLVHFRSHLFLLTAAHVLDQWGGKPIILGLPSGNIEITIPAIKSKSRRYDHQDDLIDIAYFPLYNNFRKHLNGLFGLPLDEYYGEDFPFVREHLFAFGYPASKFIIEIGSRYFDAPPLQYYGNEILNDRIFTKFNLEKSKHILMSFSQRKSKSTKRKGYTIAPKPKGCSGGAIFRVYVNSKDELELMIFEGMLTDLLGESKTYMNAIRKQAIREFILGSNPGLSLME